MRDGQVRSLLGAKKHLVVGDIPIYEVLPVMLIFSTGHKSADFNLK